MANRSLVVFSATEKLPFSHTDTQGIIKMNAYETRMELLKIAAQIKGTSSFPNEVIKAAQELNEFITNGDSKNRKIIYVDVGTMTVEEAREYLEKIKEEIGNKRKLIPIDIVSRAFLSIGYKFDHAGNLITTTETNEEEGLTETFPHLTFDDNNPIGFNNEKGFIPIKNMK